MDPMSRTVARALELLEVVIAAPGPVTLMEVVETTGIDKSTAQRILTFLVDRGSLSRDSATKRFGIGPLSFALAAAVGSRNDIRLVAGPHLRSLQESTGESVSLHMRVGARRVCVDGQESTHPVRRVIPLGESLPIQLGPSGKVILAHLPGDETAELTAAAGLSPTEVRELARDLAQVREHGFLHTEGDRTTGIRAVSVPIFDANGVTGSITVAGPSARWTQDAADAKVPQVVAAAKTISTNLGAPS
jgi:IclR family acetate operon transcriptional repressor